MKLKSAKCALTTRSAVAAEALFDEHLEWAEEKARRWCRAHRVPRHMRDDLLQATRMSLWRMAQIFRFGEASFRTLVGVRLINAMRREMMLLGRWVARVPLGELAPEREWAELDPSAEPERLQVDAVDEVKHRVLARVTGRERRIIARRMAGLNCAEIGREEHLTRERVRQIMEQIRARLAENN